ncbi:hypothetical protein OG216_36890 [Streptomycetaceae bacterium NBC_01309]
MRITRQPQTTASRRRRRGRSGGFGRRGRAAVVAGAACALVLAAGPLPAEAENGVPTPETLSLALLEPADIGPAVSEDAETTPDDASADPAGCPALDSLRNGPSADEPDPWPEVQLIADAVVIQEKLIAGPPETIAASHAALREALSTCTSLTFPANDGSAPLTVDLSPITFGGPDSIAVRLDGTYEGIPVNGYLALEPLGAVELVYMFVQAGDDSSQLASAIYAIAVDKVHQVVGPAAGTPKPLATPAPDNAI